jgi:FAD synthase
VEYLRPEAKFDSNQELTAAMDKDAVWARQILADANYAQDRFSS